VNQQTGRIETMHWMASGPRMTRESSAENDKDIPLQELKLFCGNANLPLAKKIAEHLKMPLGDRLVDKFKDGEIQVQIEENVRGEDIFVIQSTNPPSENLMELLIIIDALRRASARRITAVVPYFGYARQDRKDKPRVPITAKLVANLLTVAGADRIVTVDLHAGQIQGFFDIPFDNLYAAPSLMTFLKNEGIHVEAVVAPDIGSVAMARAFAEKMGVKLGIIDKRRPTPNEAKAMHVIVDVKNKDCLLLDDMIDTGGSLKEAARAAKEHGAKRVYAACTHGLFSGNAISNIEESAIEFLIVTDTVHRRSEINSEKIKTLSLSELLGDAIWRIHMNRSVSSLFEYPTSQTTEKVRQ
jgi:ribose-phosphate pyrophosphokinase